MKAYFTCGVKDCNHVQEIDRPGDMRRYSVCKSHMVDHYKWEHADMIGTKVHPYRDDPNYYRYDYRPIPDDIGPTLTYGTGTNTWAEICEIEGRA